MPILWHLSQEDPRRYNELKRDIPLITNIMLTQFLRERERSHLVIRKNYDTILRMLSIHYQKEEKH